MIINIDDNYVLSDSEKHYIINLILGVFNIKKTKSAFVKLANSINSSGPESVNQLIENIIDYASKKSDIDKNSVISAVAPSINYYFNNVHFTIRKKSFDIRIFDKVDTTLLTNTSRV